MWRAWGKVIIRHWYCCRGECSVGLRIIRVLLRVFPEEYSTDRAMTLTMGYALGRQNRTSWGVLTCPQAAVPPPLGPVLGLAACRLTLVFCACWQVMTHKGAMG